MIEEKHKIPFCICLALYVNVLRGMSVWKLCYFIFSVVGIYKLWPLTVRYGVFSPFQLVALTIVVET